MKELFTIHKLLIQILFVVLFLTPIEFSQQLYTSDFQYLSPVPGSRMNQPETNIIIRYGIPYNPGDILNKDILQVVGNKSGTHSGKIILAEDNRTMLFLPDSPFSEGENVNVTFLKQIRTTSNEIIPNLEFSFQITKNNINKLVRRNPEKYFLKLNPEFVASKKSSPIFKQSDSPVYSVMDDSLPVGFPPIYIDSLNNPTPGFIFLTPFSFQNTHPNYLIIMDNYGVPVFYRKTIDRNFDFKKQATDVLTYLDGFYWKFYVLNSSYQIIDSLYTKNGYALDVHDALVLPNNHSLLLGSDSQPVRMDTVVPGGNPNAIVMGLIIQELDEYKNVVFQWRSWDHFDITDATYDINLTDSIVDYVHANAIDVDSDGNILVSSRHMDEVTKIDRQTGNIIWRWGGQYCENNQFTFIGDSTGFSHQHDIRRLTNGNLTVFDNGNLHSPTFSRAVEYQVDEINKIAFLVWDYKNNPITYSGAMGCVRRLSNHNTVIGWGTGVHPAISEVDPFGNVVLFISLPDTLVNYRGFKSQWKTNLFFTNPDSLIFGYVPIGDSLEMSLDITNNSNQQIEINDTYNRYSAYHIITNLPLVIPPFGTESISVKFRPETDGDYFDDLHLRWNTEVQRIAQVAPLIGSTDPNYNSVKTENLITDYSLSQNYPNPFNPTTKISWQLPTEQKVSIVVYDILGRQVKTLVNEEKPAGKYQVIFDASSAAGGLPSGIYFYNLRAGNFVQTKKMLLLK